MAESWKQTMQRLIDGAESELRSSARAKTRAGLREFRVRLRARRIAVGQKKFETELEAFLQGDRLLRAATQRYLDKQVKLAREQMVAVLKSVDAAVARFRTPVSRSKVGTKWAPARKSRR
jgi:hypothetical protein